MSDFLTEQDCQPNLNAATIAGKVIKVASLSGKTPGLSVIVGYVKQWPNGGSQEIPLRCYVTGEARLEKLHWLKVGEVILVHGEVTNTGAIYGHRIEQLSRPEREPGEEDIYLTGMR